METHGSLTVLVTGVGSTTGLSVIKALRKQQSFAVRVIGTDINAGDTIAGSEFCDAFVQVPRASDDDYVPTLLDICRRERVGALIPIVDPEVLAVAERRDEFGREGTRAIVASAEAVRVCNDKYETYKAFRDLGVPTPATWLPGQIDDDRVPFPVIVKPADGVSSVGVARVDDAAQLRAALAATRRPVIQEYLSGAEFTIDVVSDRTGEPLAVVPRERIETRSGISYKGRTVRDEAMISGAAAIARGLKLEGPCNVQCRVPDGTPVFFEINPRFSGTLPLTVAAGVNSVEIALLSAFDAIPPGARFDFREGVSMSRYWEEVFRYGA
jgi:carbamoyl-phosphate synthase large subunit